MTYPEVMTISKQQSIIAIQGECTTDVAGGATIEHGAGRVPTAVVITAAGPGQLASVPLNKITDTTFWAKFNWHDGGNFKPGTKIRFNAIVTVPADEPEPEEPEPVAVWSSSDPKAVWATPTPDVFIRNEVWNTAEAGPQTITVYDDLVWSVSSTQPKEGAREGSVKSYPCTQFLFRNPPISSFKKIRSSFWHYAPPTGIWNAAYDVWVGGLGSKSTAEVMIWTDYRYPGSLPPSNALKTARLTIDGIDYIAWTRKNSNGGDYIALVAQQKRDVGSYDLLDIFNRLIQLGWLKATDTLAAINYGIEICSTEGLAWEFQSTASVVTD